MTKQSGSITVFQALLLGPLPLSVLLMQDWYVDVNAPGCPVGTGTQSDPFCDIMDAVAAASDGDTIHIAPGTYFENVVLGDKDLDLIGTGGDQVTILDGMASGSVMSVGPAVVTLTGLTLTNGSGSPHPNGYGLLAGGGLFADASAMVGADLPRLTLVSCTVTGNSVMGSSEVYGGGIFILGSSNQFGTLGSLTITNSTVSSNTTAGTASYGGGIQGEVGTLTLMNSTVSANTSMGSRASGGGVHARGHIVTLTNSTVSGNTVTSSSTGYGGGMLVEGTGSFCPRVSLEIRNSIIGNNSALGPTNYGPAGSGLTFNGPCGDGLTIVNTTVTGNADSGIVINHAGPAHIGNSILWNNGSVPLLQYPSGPPTVDHSLVEGGWSGVGNIDADPLFTDELNHDFRLLPGSPCIDSGNNAVVPADVTSDIRGFPRFVDDPFTPDTGIPFRWRRTGPSGLHGTTPSRRPVVDLGAYEFP